MVGLDTMVKVANNTYEACPDDEARENFRIPAYINTMMENKWLGDKSGQGFSKGEGDDGKSQILTLDLKTMEYGTQSKPKFATVGEAKQVDDLKQRLVILHNGKIKPAISTGR